MIIRADARRIPLVNESVQMCVTSPPYWAQRDYGFVEVGQLGTEGTPDAYVAGMVSAFREVRRVLKPNGTLWLNLGDSYARPGSGLKNKDMAGVPWAVALALRGDGWFLRCDIVWAKPNVFPENVSDRPTREHEYIFLMTKSSEYFYDSEAIQEPAIGAARVRSDRFGGNKHGANTTKHNDGSIFVNATIRNARSVWRINTESYNGAHFATFPVGLAKRCIRAGSREGDLVLDPFAGSGSTALAARSLGRRPVLIELNQQYCDLAKQRLAGVPTLTNLFAEHSTRAGKGEQTP